MIGKSRVVFHIFVASEFRKADCVFHGTAYQQYTEIGTIEIFLQPHELHTSEVIGALFFRDKLKSSIQNTHITYFEDSCATPPPIEAVR